MAAGRKNRAVPPEKVRKTLYLDADQLRRLRELLAVSDDAEVVRIALTHLLEHFPDSKAQEEE